MAFSSWYYGMDDASGTPFPCAGDGPNFYLGLIGGETSLRSGYFDEAAATKAGKDHTFAVWDVAGPGTTGGKPAGMSAEDWGIAQGNAFYNALNSTTSPSPYASYIGGQTYFADIERGNGGWVSGTTQDDNTATLFGFLDSIWGGGGEDDSTVGAYIGPSFWTEFFGADYTSQIPIVVWAAGSPYCPDDCIAAANDFNDYYADMVVGGYKVMIWQYHPSSGCGSPAKDLDITPYAGYQNSKWSPTT